MSDTAESTEAVQPAGSLRTIRLTFGLIVLLILGALAVLPMVVASLRTELIGRQTGILYDFPSGEPITVEKVEQMARSRSFFNISVIDIDEEIGSATIGVAGDRLCPEGDCRSAKATLIAFNGDPRLRRGLPPSATLDLEANDVVFSEQVTLPVEGWPGLYPFDTYTLRMGIVIEDADPSDGVMDQAELRQEAFGTIQNGLRNFLMRPPAQIDPGVVQVDGDPMAPIGVQDLTFERPAYLRFLSVVLVALIAVSAFMSMNTRTPTEALLGLGSLVLGVWGVRSVLVPSGFSVITAVDIALSLIIVVLLLGLGVRAALHLHRRSEFPPVTLPQRMAGHGHGGGRQAAGGGRQSDPGGS